MAKSKAPNPPSPLPIPRGKQRLLQNLVKASFKGIKRRSINDVGRKGVPERNNPVSEKTMP